MVRIFCTIHNIIVNAYPKYLYDKKYKGKDLISKSRGCNCIFDVNHLTKFRVFNKITYYLQDGTEIKKINPTTNIKYELIKRK